MQVVQVIVCTLSFFSPQQLNFDLILLFPVIFSKISDGQAYFSWIGLFLCQNPSFVQNLLLSQLYSTKFCCILCPIFGFLWEITAKLPFFDQYLLVIKTLLFEILLQITACLPAKNLCSVKTIVKKNDAVKLSLCPFILMLSTCTMPIYILFSLIFTRKF